MMCPEAGPRHGLAQTAHHRMQDLHCPMGVRDPNPKTYAGGAGHQPGEPAQHARAHAPLLVLFPRAQALGPHVIAGTAPTQMRCCCYGLLAVQPQVLLSDTRREKSMP